MKKLLFLCICFLLFLAPNSNATSITMQGDYVLTAVGGNGTLGAGSITYPGIRHDETGTGNFPPLDYLTPGTPWEIFGIESTETGLIVNNNTTSDSGSISSTSLTDLSSTSVYDHHVNWTGIYSSYFSITHDYFFNDGDERISITTQITALTDLHDLNFVRAIDPDQDSYVHSTPDTYNGRGYDSNNDGDYDDPGDISPKDWVHSEGPYSGLTLGLYSNSTYEHNTGITGWTTDPDTYLAGTNVGDGDKTIGIAFNLGTLTEGDIITLDYAYVMGDSLETVDIPDPVPEPATMLLLGSGIFGLTGLRKRFTKK